MYQFQCRKSRLGLSSTIETRMYFESCAAHIYVYFDLNNVLRWRVNLNERDAIEERLFEMR